MSTHKYIDRLCIIVLALTLLLTVTFMNGEKLGLKVITDEDAETYSGSTYFTKNDKDGDWEENEYTTHISLDGSDGTIDGNGAYFLNGNLVISQAGWYVISGSLEDGKIVVDASDSSKVWIKLNGVTINCSDDACLRVNQADKVFLTLADGTENSFTSGNSYSEEALSDNTGGTIFSHDDLTINGSGSLTVTAEYKHGLDVNDSLVITGGNITITAPQDGIHVNDSFRLMDAMLTLDVGDDGVHSDDELYIESGTVLISSSYEGFEAVTVDIVGGDITIYSTDDGINANGGSTMMGPGNMNGGPPPLPPDHGGNNRSDNSSNTNDGTNNMSSRPPLPPNHGGSNMGDNSSNTNDATNNMSSRPPLPPNHGGSNMGDNSSSTNDGTNNMSSQAEDKETYIRISGGNLTIINENGRDADGLDSNGSIYIDGGNIRISLPGEGTNNAIDYGSESGGECIVTGGTVLAFGGSGMVEEFSANSTQCAVLYNLDSSVAGGTIFRVLDKNGDEIMSYAPVNNYTSVGFSSPELTVGKTYSIMYGNHTDELTPESLAVSVGTSGGMQPSHMGPGGQQSFSTNSGDSTSRPPAPPNESTETQDQNYFNDSVDGAAQSFSDHTEQTEGETNHDGFSQSDKHGRTTENFDSNDTSESENSATVVNGVLSVQDIDAEDWILLGMCIFILFAGILFAKNYRKNG